MKLREGWKVQNSRWGTLMVVSARTGIRVCYDMHGDCVRLYAEQCRFKELDVTSGTWKQVAHAYLVSVGSESPWEVTP